MCTVSHPLPPHACSSCPHNTHCATLSEYAQEAKMYFTSNTTMVFLPGDHVLDRNITVNNVTRLTMHGESSSDNRATVVRNGSVGFSFTNMVNFNIYFLAFTSYNRSWGYGRHHASNSALLLQSTKYAKLVNCTFHDNIGTALAVHNTNITLVENNFMHNQCGCESLSERCELGCGITANNSNLMFTGSTTFLKNRCNNFGALYTVGAGAIWGAASLLHFTGTNNFFDNVNSATLANGRPAGAGGAIHITSNALLILHGKNNFINNSAAFGGAIASRENVTFKGTNRFSGNSAVYGGGAIYARGKISLTFIGTSNFSNNSAGYSGGAIYAAEKVVFIFNGVNNFINNSATNGGAIRTSHNVVLCISNTTNFTSNSANDGGAIYAFSGTTLTFVGNSDFSNNSADYNGGAIQTSHNVVLKFSGTNIFINNSAKSSGGAIFTTINISLSFTGTSSFSNNSAMQGGTISANVNSTLTFDGNITFTNNGHNTNKIDFHNADNEETRGGAIYLDIRSTFSILPHTTVHWENNHATLGGAIYVSDVNPLIYCTQIATFIQREECFFQITGQSYEVTFVFKNNSADDAGSVLYGGAIDNCKLTHDLDSYGSGDVFNWLFHINNDLNTTSKISSDPLHIYLCKSNLPDCSGPQCHNFSNPVYPGETFQISVVAVGQRNGTVSSTVRSTVSAVRASKIFHPANLLDYQYLQQTNNTCTKLNYTVFSLSQKVNITLHPEGSPCSKYNGGLQYFSVTINQTCPPGFNISKSARSCICEPRLAQYTNQCNITNGVGQITRDSDKQFWVGYDTTSQELILHPHCPFDYCVNDAVVFPLNNTDVQCTFNRSGLLCGRCKEGYSLALGTHQCRKCNNSHLALLIAFALMGVALVILLFVCKLTVATGTLSGLVFYANIVGVNRTIFLPAESTDALSVYIAWLNLDFGIETCFYKGMDAYSKTWLQFVFSVYIWMLVGLMILVSHYSQRFTNLLGSNPVSVLATLILLSYTKVLNTLISASSFADLDYPDNSTRRVWLYDANIDYLLGKHIPLFLMALFFLLFLFLPYTLLLLFGQWLQAISHLRLFSWGNSSRLKHFMDSYHAPYKPKHRYWPGLLLVLRVLFTLVFAFHGPTFNLLAIVVGAGVLQLWVWVSGGIYKNWCLDALEGSFVLNLIILGAATYYVDQINGNKLAVGYTSVSIALSTFIGILAYHIFQQLRYTKLWKKVPKLNMKLRFKKLNTKLNNKLNIKEAEDNLNNLTNDTTESGKFNQLREPLLDDPSQPTHSVV